MTQFINKKVTFIGGGHITEILLEKLLQHTLNPTQITISSRGITRLNHLRHHFGVTTMQDNLKSAQQADFIFIAVRPNVVPTVIETLKSANLTPHQIVISLAAGTPLSHFRDLPSHQPIIRAMPNPPSRIGQGVVAICASEHVSTHQKQKVEILLSSLGQLVTVDESQLDLLTALTSPVTTLMYFQSLLEIGLNGGLTEPVAAQIVTQTIIGTLGLVQDTAVSPQDLISEASTPGGISIESVAVLEKLGFKSIVMEAIASGEARANQLSQSKD